MKKLLATSVILGFTSFAIANSFYETTAAPTNSFAATACVNVSCSAIYNAKADALNYNGGEISATLLEGITALDANYDTTNLSVEQKIQHIGNSF